MESENRDDKQLPVVIEDRARALIDPARLQYAGYHEARPEAGADMPMRQLFGILRRHSTLIAVLTLVGGLLAIIATLFVPPQYTARAQIVVEPRQVAAPGTTASLTANAGSVDAETIDTLIAMLAARDHLRSVLTSLSKDPALTGHATPGSQSSAPAGEDTGQAGTIARLWTRTEDALTAGWTHLRNLVGAGAKIPAFENFERTLSIEQERKSRVISVRYTSRNPEFAAAAVNGVIELYARDQEAKIAAEGQAELDELDRRLGDLEKTMALTEARVRKQLTEPGTDLSGPVLKQLEREIIENTQNYDRLSNRRKQLRAEIEARTPSFKVLYLATPPVVPSSLDSKYLIVAAIILALLAGAVLAVIRESFDRTLRSGKQVLGSLGVLCAGLVPRVGWLQSRRPHEYLLKRPYSPYAEAIRSLGAALQFTTNKGKRPQVVQITSSVRAEGKSTLATSLAVYATRIYPRVLLIDLDFRRPSIAASFGITAERNILDYMVSTEALADGVHHVPSLGLDVLPMTVCPIDPVTLFSSNELERFLDRLRKDYDFIVMDSPPLQGVAEASLLATLSDLVLVAVKWGSTRVDVAQHAIGELRGAGLSKDDILKRVMCVITQVQLKRHARYQYGDTVETMVKYRSSYQPSHELRPASFQPDR